MALSAVVGTASTWLLQNRQGGKVSGTVYDCLVSDLAVGDYLAGMRAFVTTIGSTTGGNTTFTLTRLGFTWTQTLVATHTLRIVR